MRPRGDSSPPTVRGTSTAAPRRRRPPRSPPFCPHVRPSRACRGRYGRSSTCPPTNHVGHIGPRERSSVCVYGRENCQSRSRTVSSQNHAGISGGARQQASNIGDPLPRHEAREAATLQDAPPWAARRSPRSHLVPDRHRAMLFDWAIFSSSASPVCGAPCERCCHNDSTAGGGRGWVTPRLEEFGLHQYLPHALHLVGGVAGERATDDIGRDHAA